jgi:hypothetical protein
MLDPNFVLTLLQTISIMVGIAYYILNIHNNQRNQRLTLETRQASLFMQMYNRLMSDIQDLEVEEVVTNQISGFEEFREKMASDGNFKQVFNRLAQFFEALGVLVKLGYVNIDIVALMWTSMTKSFWENLLEPMIDEQREFYNYSGIWAESEYLYRELMKFRDQHPDT